MEVQSTEAEVTERPGMPELPTALASEDDVVYGLNRLGSEPSRSSKLRDAIANILARREMIALRRSRVGCGRSGAHVDRGRGIRVAGDGCRA